MTSARTSSRKLPFRYDYFSVLDSLLLSFFAICIIFDTLL